MESIFDYEEGQDRNLQPKVVTNVRASVIPTVVVWNDTDLFQNASQTNVRINGEGNALNNHIKVLIAVDT